MYNDNDSHDIRIDIAMLTEIAESIKYDRNNPYYKYISNNHHRDAAERIKRLAEYTDTVSAIRRFFDELDRNGTGSESGYTVTVGEPIRDLRGDITITARAVPNKNI